MTTFNVNVNTNRNRQFLQFKQTSFVITINYLADNCYRILSVHIITLWSIKNLRNMTSIINRFLNLHVVRERALRALEVTFSRENASAEASGPTYTLPHPLVLLLQPPHSLCGSGSCLTGGVIHSVLLRLRLMLRPFWPSIVVVFLLLWMFCSDEAVLLARFSYVFFFS
jgi:hypothetical protein